MLKSHVHVLGDLTRTNACPMCEGDGHQLETVWVPGRDPFEREVACYQCEGRGHVIRLSCGRCGATSVSAPEDPADDIHTCSMCGHQAPKVLWLPMLAFDDKETG